MIQPLTHQKSPSITSTPPSSSPARRWTITALPSDSSAENTNPAIHPLYLLPPTAQPLSSHSIPTANQTIDIIQIPPTSLAYDRQRYRPRNRRSSEGSSSEDYTLTSSDAAYFSKNRLNGQLDVQVWDIIQKEVSDWYRPFERGFIRASGPVSGLSHDNSLYSVHQSTLPQWSFHGSFEPESID